MLPQGHCTSAWQDILLHARQGMMTRDNGSQLHAAKLLYVCLKEADTHGLHFTCAAGL